VIPAFHPTDVDPRITADITQPGRQAGGVLTIEPAEYRKLGEQLRPVQDAFARTAARLAAGTSIGQLGADLGLGSEIRDLLPSTFAPFSFDLLRLDFILSDGVPVVLEANYGAAVGGSIDAEAHAAAAGAPAAAPNTSRMQWAAQRARELGHDELFLPMWPWTHITEPLTYFASSRAATEEAGVELKILSFDAFAQLRRDDPRPRVALRLFATLDAVRREVDLASLGYVPGGEVTWLQDEAVAIPSNKALMASTVFRQLLPANGAVVPASQLVGDTPRPGFLVQGEALVGSRRHEGVLKPTSDHGGTGVVVGPGATEADWTAATEAAGRDLTVIQDFYPTDEAQFANRYPDGTTEVFAGPVSYGAYFVAGHMVGVLARVGSPQMRNTAVNGNTGAVLTALVPREGQ